MNHESWIMNDEWWMMNDEWFNDEWFNDEWWMMNDGLQAQSKGAMSDDWWRGFRCTRPWIVHPLTQATTLVLVTDDWIPSCEGRVVLSVNLFLKHFEAVFLGECVEEPWIVQMKLLPCNNSAVSEVNCDNEAYDVGAGYAFCHDFSMRGWPLVGMSSIENDWAKNRIHPILTNRFLEFWLRKTPCCLQDVLRRGLSVQRVPSWFCGQWSPTMPTWGHEAAFRVGHRVVFDDSMLHGGYSKLFPSRKAAVLRSAVFVFCRVMGFEKVQVILVWCIRPSSACKAAQSWCAGSKTIYRYLGH